MSVARTKRVHVQAPGSESGRARFELSQVEREVDGVDVETALVQDRQTGDNYDANYRDESPAFAFIEGFQLAERLLTEAVREGVARIKALRVADCWLCAELSRGDPDDVRHVPDEKRATLCESCARMVNDFQEAAETAPEAYRGMCRDAAADLRDSAEWLRRALNNRTPDFREAFQSVRASALTLETEWQNASEGAGEVVEQDPRHADGQG